MADKIAFEQFYETKLTPALQPLEQRRKAVSRNILICCGGTVLLAVLLAGVLLTNSQDSGLLFIPLLIAGAVITFIFKMMSAGYVNDFKNQVVALIVQYISPDLTYFPQSGISQTSFLTSGIFLHGIDRYRCEDLVQGMADKTRIEFSEIHAEYKTETRDSKGRSHTQWHTIFKGLFFIADFNKNFNGSTFILPDTAEKLLGRFGQKFQEMNRSHGQLIKLEDPAFEQEFAVYGTDQIEARYILSPSLMSRILEFKRKTGSKVHFSFTGGEVNIGISSDRNRFEPKIFRTVLDIALARGFVADLQLALGIVEDLNLNTRIWTKE